MSAPVIRRAVDTFRSFLGTKTPVKQCVAYKKSRAAKIRQFSRAPGKHRGWKKLPGDYVEKGMILYRQMGLKYYPGENVGCGRDLTLFALEPGRVEITVERLSPHPDSPLYRTVQAGKRVDKKFFHVVSKQHEPRFKLVSQT